ncbi:unnamed protein product [Oppiella nova]|uniref:Uncharacterized protein n=1 Tax=Oppiella nova TaxID=334625 RepID=A0A7R9MFH4_9ACAR|nr:unnamed protein product [Oppiella nova]CAG2176393.1 unnamed protein product [Oppiella nova]
MAQRDHNINIDLGKIFRMGLLTGTGGTKLGIDVLNGFVNVGVDRNRYPGYSSSSGYPSSGGVTGGNHVIDIEEDPYIRPVRTGSIRDRIRNKYIYNRRGATDVNVSVG